MKMASQRFCLRWNNHQSNLLSVFDQLLHAETFTDVTLAVDGQYLKAHKMVLSACSPYFNALFLNHPEKHPIVILKDVPYADMKSLLDFMYRGEVSVDQERLTAFLRVAESLRIKGLTEVNDDKPTNTEPTPQPPQLQRIQPYMVQQQQQRHKSHQSSAMNSSSNSGQNSSSQQHLQQQQQQQSLLSSALASMPKRKRGRPRKLSGSDDGDYDEFDGEMGDGKMCNDSYSGNDDGSDDNQRDSGNNDDLNESRDSVSPSKKSKQQMKDIRNQQQQDDNSTSVHLITSTAELSQRLFGVNKNNFNNTTTIPINTTTTSTNNNNNSNSTLISLQAPTQNTTATKTAAIEFNEALTAHLPTVLGLKIKSNLQQNVTTTAGQQQQQQQAQQQQQTSTVPINNNPNSLLKQQLRAGLKELIDVTITNATNNTTNTLSQTNAPNTNTNANVSHLETQEACSALQSLANVAERQAQNNIQPPSANNLHHQFLLHMAANPILKSSGEFFHQQNALLMREEEHNLDLLMDQSDKSDPEMLTLADENAGLDYSTGNETGGGNQTGSNEQLDTSTNSGNNNDGSNNTTPRAKNSTGKPVQRRRIRRKAQSSIDDQAEQLTEMSVRGLDLFRYASINEGVYQCTECAKENMQKTFKNKYSFQRHAFLYHEGKHRKVFPCPLCGKEFSRPDKMKNHMKMTHESFVAKEIQNFNPLNYLITAAGEIQASFTTTTTTNTLTSSNVVSTPQPLLNQLQANNPALSIMINNNDNNEEAGLNLTQQQQQLQQQQQQQQENLNDFNLPKPLKFPTDIEIKNEIVISPSPSPPPVTQPQTVANIGSFSSNNTSTPISLAETLSLLKTSVQTTSSNGAQLNAQRLEEVK
ncbi:protein tramtrack, alpha isoform isoform X1 [Lucilia sericata]|uniref:protein tramtrack, alpha isoform isoform X1 n=1 Tax=Lucilia sericata TaxID=13632 RepID=UPI0018A81AD1|nr:protein tramtrack, alpha isoform isoform X1 [Lucilia sericata]XP_037812359.1 protein tramtrack, alpha isoform isoform X1 [Lucilia sericata]XP_037812360.1 protein tramtrack, alpha isoform isoform X1 [Lucilia sericata]XP_037812361.1 protein tramtrack, alpha isoform isoform X1 [Lucilia sericata]XP_037812362.1 protein tramtrack, alpha isoform isoform X1 [Lucilia sericata]